MISLKSRLSSSSPSLTSRKRDWLEATRTCQASRSSGVDRNTYGTCSFRRRVARRGQGQKDWPRVELGSPTGSSPHAHCASVDCGPRDGTHTQGPVRSTYSTCDEGVLRRQFAPAWGDPTSGLPNLSSSLGHDDHEADVPGCGPVGRWGESEFQCSHSERSSWATGTSVRLGGRDRRRVRS